MPTDLGLGTSLVDNPVAADGETGEEELVLLLPPQLQRVGALLSTPEGKPTALCKGVYAVLAVPGLWLFVPGYGAWGSSTREKLASGDTVGAVQDLCAIGGMLLAGPVAVHTLRVATRPNGFLVQLGMGTAYVPHVVVENLESSERALRHAVTALIVLITMFFVLITMLVVLSPVELLKTFSFPAVIAVWFATIGIWWYTLKVASALAASPVDAARRDARAEATRLRESGEPMDPERWRTLLEEPVLKLGRETLRTLSNGWGPSVLFVGAGLVLFALFWGLVFKHAGLFDTILTDALGFAYQLICVAMVVSFGLTPFLLAWEPAAVSSNCAKLEDDINDLYGEDQGFIRALNSLKYVQSLNKQQGLGFVVGGQVVTKRTLKILATGIYSAIVVFGPTLETELGLAGGSCGSAQHAACDFGWTFADDSCFKLFGDGVLGVPLGWAAAEEACQAMGSQMHLASVTSEEQQRAVEHLSGNGGVWIGLNDFGEEGSFAWSDDEPLEYNNWEPNDESQKGEDGGDGICLDEGSSRWVDRDGATLYPYICAKKATPVAASGGEMNGCTDGRWVMGTPYKQPTSLGMRLAPTIVYGVYKARIYEEIVPRKIALNETITTAAECAAVVHRDYETANAAVYSNVGREECWAVFEAAGMIYDPVLQTCLFKQA
jgi:hypothetical protein